MRELQELRDVAPPSDRHARLAPELSPLILEACRSASLTMGAMNLSRIGVTSSIRGEGRSTISIAVAILQQRDYGRRVILVELDFDHPAMAEQLDLLAVPGLAELARGEATLGDALQPVTKGIDAITAGKTDSPARVLTTLIAADLLGDLGELGDVVVGDLPPLLTCSFSRLAASVFPHLVLLVRAGITPLGQVREAAASLPVEPVLLLNGAYTSLPRWIRRLSGS